MSNVIDSINEVIRTRRSIFPPSYIEKEIPKELIETILGKCQFRTYA